MWTIPKAWMPVVTNFLGGSLRLPLQVNQQNHFPMILILIIIILTSITTEVLMWHRQCPIHPWRDQHGQAELSKLHYRVTSIQSRWHLNSLADRCHCQVNLWTCATCGKSFSGEPELEQHIAKRHPDLASPGESKFSLILNTLLAGTVCN